MTTQRQLLTALIAVLAAALISFVLTPVVKALAPKFGFVDEGVTDKSTDGNVAWHQMRLTF